VTVFQIVYLVKQYYSNIQSKIIRILNTFQNKNSNKNSQPIWGLGLRKFGWSVALITGPATYPSRRISRIYETHFLGKCPTVHNPAHRPLWHGGGGKLCSLVWSNRKRKQQQHQLNIPQPFIWRLFETSIIKIVVL
jgi:hypothetical protein